MDINDNQQINTFLKGMNTDVSDALIDSSQYRYAENLRLVTNTDSNTGELRPVDGTVSLYNFAHKLWTNVKDEAIDIMYFNSIRNYVVSILRKDDRVWYVVVSTDGGETWQIIFGPCSDKIWTDTDRKSISGVLRWENDNDIKLYFVDDTSDRGIIVIQIDESHWGDYKDDLGNPLTELDSLYGYQNTVLPAPKIELGEEFGNIQSAQVQYAYRLYKTGGAATTLSPLSNMLSLYKDSTTGYKQLQYSNKSVKINISGLNDKLDRIQLYRINYVQNGQDPTIHLIYDNIIDKTVDIHDRYAWRCEMVDNGHNIEQVSTSEFTSLVVESIYPRLLESKEDYLFAGNISYAKDDIDTKIFETDEDIEKFFGESSLDDKSDRAYVMPVYSDWETINLKNEFLNENVNQHRSLRRGETYRYGIIFYNKEGKATSVYHLKGVDMNKNYTTSGDLEVPEFDPNSDIRIIKDDDGREQFLVRRIGAKVYIPRWQPGAQAYLVVRCIRRQENKKTLFQGITGYAIQQTLMIGTDSQTKVVSGKSCPPGPITMHDVVVLGRLTGSQGLIAARSTGNVMIFACPEYAYQDDDVKNILTTYASATLKKVVSYSLYTKKDDSAYYGGNLYSGPYSSYSKELNPEHSYGITYEYHDPIISWDAFSAKANYIVKNTLIKDRLAFFNHYVPEAVDDDVNDAVPDSIEIESFAYPEVPAYNTFANGEEIRALDDVTVIGKLEFINWTMPILLHEPLLNGSTANENLRTGNGWIDDEFGDNCLICFYPIGTGGKYILFQPKDILSPINIASISETLPAEHFLPISIYNLTKTAIPYGDEYKSVYYQFGNYFDRPQVWTPDAKTNIREVEIFDGDSYFQVFNFNASHYWYDPYFGHGVYVNVYSVPIETDIDLKAQCGVIYVKTLNVEIQDVPTSGNDVIQTTPAYEYNTAYNQNPTLLSQSSTKYESVDSNNFDVRICHSLPKTNGEYIDNWLVFRPLADYIDVDTRYGQLTELRLFKNRLFYWLNNATGIVSVNERTIINDADENQIVLGTGGVLQRYDYISTVYGMKPNQFADTQSNTTLYWWDGYNKELLAHAGEALTVPMGTVKSVRNYLNAGTENAIPHLFYDVQNKEVVSSVVNNESLVYNEQIEAFTSIYKFMPLFSTTVNNNTLVTNSCEEYLYNRNDGKEVYLFGGEAKPLLKYIVNKNNTYVKTFDITTFGGRFYGGGSMENGGPSELKFTFDTPLKQHSVGEGESLITNREYDFRLDIPRNNNDSWGGRMRGKTMQCELKSDSNSIDFSLQYIITKYRMSWS